MSVVGFDIGNLTCFVAVAKQGGIETVANEYSQRSTPSFVGFTDKVRLVGLDAKNIQLTGSNFKNIVFNFKRLLGRKFSDPYVKDYCQNLPYKVVSTGESDEVGVRIKYQGVEQTLTITQVMGALLSKLKEIAENALCKRVIDCVIAVPTFYTDIERRAMLDAARIAELNCLRLMNDTTATALCYGFYRKELPQPGETARNVVFVDFGHSSLQVSAVAFTKGSVKVLGVTSDPFIGGMHIDKIMTNNIAQTFQSKYKIEPLSQVRPYLKLMGEAEKLKVLMSANKRKLPLSIECYMDDKDVHVEMSRDEMEQLSDQMFQRMRRKLEEIFTICGLQRKNIHSVEIVGGSSRVTLFKSIVQEVFGVEPSTTLNCDESVARGCALQCAMLSSASQVQMKWNITDVCQYPITMRWKPMLEKDGSIEVFPYLHLYPATKMLTFYRQEAFDLEASYTYPDNVPYHTPFIGKFTVHDVHPAPDGSPSKVKVKLHLNKHGIFNVSEAICVEKIDEKAEDMAETESPEKPGEGQGGGNNEEKNAENNEQQQQQPMDVNGGDPTADPDEPKEPTTTSEQVSRKKTKFRNKNLPVKHNVSSLNFEKINELKKTEAAFQATVQFEKEKADQKNALEEYVLEMRRQIDEELEPFIKSNDAQKLKSTLNDVEDWLMEDGEDCEKQVYVDKLAEMRKMGNPIVSRKIEFDTRPAVLDKFGARLQFYSKILDSYSQGSPDYEHISEEDMKKVKKTVDEKRKWFDDACNKLSKVEKHQNPPILVSNINDEHKSLDAICNPIVSKPKPKVEPPPPEPNTNNAGPGQPDGNTDASKDPVVDDPKSPQDHSQTQMDVDGGNNFENEVD